MLEIICWERAFGLTPFCVFFVMAGEDLKISTSLGSILKKTVNIRKKLIVSELFHLSEPATCILLKPHLVHLVG